MPSSRTRIVPEVDFTKDGRQHGFLRLFHSVHSSAYGFLPIPIVVLKHGEGPTALFVSGNHGDPQGFDVLGYRRRSAGIIGPRRDRNVCNNKKHGNSNNC